jgi:hypothetical protein
MSLCVKTCAGIKNIALKVKNGPQGAIWGQNAGKPAKSFQILIFHTILEHRLPNSDYLATP